MEPFFMLGGVAVLAATIGVVIYRSFDKVRRDAESYRRLTGLQSTPDAYSARGGTSPEEMARAIEAIALEVERISEGQRFVTKLLAERRRPEGHVSPLSPIPGLGQR